MLTANSIVRAVNALFVSCPIALVGDTLLIYLGAVPAASDTISPDKLLKDFQSASNSGSQKHREVKHITSNKRTKKEEEEEEAHTQVLATIVAETAS